MSDELLDQGVTRLQLLAFLRGDDSDVWNGSPRHSRWVRYRAHQVERIPTPDGNWVQLCHYEHDGSLRAAEWTLSTSDQDAIVTARMIDTIIDAAIAHHGPDGAA